MNTEQGTTFEIEDGVTAAAEESEAPAPEVEESMESLLAQQDRFSEMLVGKKPVWVKVIQVTKDQVLVDIGEKREGVVPLSEFVPPAALHAAARASQVAPAETKPAEAKPAKDGAPRGAVLAGAGRPTLAGEGGVPLAVDGKDGAPLFPEARRPSVGQRIPVILVAHVRQDGPTLLSYRRAKETLAWESARKAYTEKSRVRGTVTMSVKGGFLVDVGGVRAFLPASLADLRPVRSPERMLGTGVRCYIIEINESKKQVVLSRKAVLEEDAAKRRSKVLSEIRVGEVRIGRVIHSAPSGLLVDIGGIEGFVRSLDISWGQPKPCSEFVRGMKLKVKVLGKPEEGSPDRIALGMKQLVCNPADALRRKYPPKTIVRGKVTEVSPQGIRLRLDDGMAACCSTSDCVEGHAYKDGEQVSGIVYGVDQVSMQLTVSLRKFDDIKERKRMASYLKAPPPLTLGELLSPVAEEMAEQAAGQPGEGGASKDDAPSRDS
ncbi:MAG: S1 RNA-binding domain-containing protein [Elusimicrobia bacterium]|nr:S1 RNA-binding domain-containing protein [Elusimicrobiota bacterium]